MKFKEAIKRFDEANENSEIPSLQNGEDRSVAKARRDAAVTAARAGLRRATDRGNVDEVDITPFAETLPEHAHQDAEERGLSRPGNYASDARLFLAGAEGRIYKRQRHGRSRVHPNWKDEYDALERAVDRSESDEGGIKAALIRLQNMALKREVRRPRDLPGRETVEEWAADEDLSDSYVRKMLRATRLIRGEWEGSELPDFDKNSAAHERGVRTLEDLGTLLEEAGCDTDPSELTPREIVRKIAPDVAWGVEKYLDRSGELSDEAVKQAWGSASRLVAGAARVGLDLSQIDPLTVFLPTVEVERDLPPQIASKIPDAVSPRVSPMDQILDEWAPRSWANSPLELTRDYSEKPFIYTDSVRGDMSTIFAVARKAYGPKMREHSPETWRTAEREFDQLKKRMDDHNKGRTTIGHKDKSKIIEQVLLPQLVCIGLPALARRVHRYRDNYFEAVEKRRQGKIAQKTLRDARTSYFTWLRRYAITSVIVDDGLRVKNYAGAVLGETVFVNYEWGKSEDGERIPTGVESITTHFRGFESPQYSRLKRRRDENDQDRQRRRQLLPGVVDHGLLADYLLQARPYLLVQAGLLPDEEAFDPTDDNFALFVSPESANHHGRYSRESVARTFGKSLHWICREILGRDVPNWDSEEHRTEWRELFAPHVNRLLVGSYWGGVRGDWAYAEFLTDDTADTLKKSYDNSASDVLQRKYQLGGWEHPEHFDDLMDRIRAGEEIDWASVREQQDLP